MKNFLRANWIILVIGVAFITSTIFALHNQTVIEKNHVIIQQTDLVRQSTQEILTRIMHGLDLGVRGFALTRDEKLLIPYREAIEMTPPIFRRIDSLLNVQHYPARSEASTVMEEVRKYTKLSNAMIEQARTGDMEAFVSLLKEDRGYEVWSKYNQFSTPLFVYEDNLKRESLDDYQFAIKSNLFLQVGILVLGLPLLYLFVSKVNAERKRRQQTLLLVDRADRTYVFDDGERDSPVDEEINTRSVSHVRQASEFISSLASGNYQVEWQGLTETNKTFNEKTLAGNLIQLKQRLNEVKLEDEKRNWTNEGLSEFSDIVRKNQNDLEQLSVQAVSHLTRYLKAQQGSLFVIESNGDEEHLRLAGCYAFDRRKFIEKKVDIGDGLLGQTFLEGESVLIKAVPQGYIHITSGLGESAPGCLLIVPMKHEGKPVAIAEFASFDVFEPHHVAFLEKAGEFFASALVNTRTTAKMKILLDEASMREVMMREREEELRQNMEELQATQEQLERNRKEHNAIA